MKRTGWIFLAVFIATMFGGCSILSGTVSAKWTPAFAAWIVVVVPLKVLNDRFEKVKWPMEFVTWAVVLLIALNLVWLGVSPG